MSAGSSKSEAPEALGVGGTGVDVASVNWMEWMPTVPEKKAAAKRSGCGDTIQLGRPSCPQREATNDIKQGFNKSLTQRESDE